MSGGAWPANDRHRSRRCRCARRRFADLLEIAGVKSPVHHLDTLGTSRFASPSGMYAEVDRLIYAKTRESACPDAIDNLVKRRLDRVVACVSG